MIKMTNYDEKKVTSIWKLLKLNNILNKLLQKTHSILIKHNTGTASKNENLQGANNISFHFLLFIALLFSEKSIFIPPGRIKKAVPPINI